MDWEDPNFLHNLGEPIRNVMEGANQRSPVRGPPRVEECKVAELPEFSGVTDPERYLDWERKIEIFFEFTELDDKKCCKYAILKLNSGASLWFEGLKAERAREGKYNISYWESLKRKLRKKICTSKPSTYHLQKNC